MSDDGGSSNFNLTFSSVRVVTSPSDHYLEGDWQTILLAPLWVFVAVGQADGPIDQKQRAALAATLERPPPGVFPAFVFSHVRKQLDALSAARESDPRTPMLGLADVNTLLRGYPNPDEADEFRRALLVLAREIALASGGGMFGRGPKVSEREAAVIAQLRATLQVPDER
jgi:hypothetical protein